MNIIKIKQKIKYYWSNLDKVERSLFVLLVLSFILRIIFLFYSPFRGWDETVYLNLGHDLSSNPLLYSLKNSGWNDFIPSTDIVYGWPNIGFRAPLLPYIFSLFYFLKLEFFIPIIIPLFSTGSVFLVYVLGKKLFDKKIGLYGAMLFSLVPINIYCSEKIWSDSLFLFFILLTFVAFWKGYEEGSKKHKVLFGLFLALSLFARYTTMWVIPIFLFYFLLKYKSLKFLNDKYLWYAIMTFLVTLIPWFIYGFVYYGNPLGSFIHGFQAATYWGGGQSWSYFFENSWRIFSVSGILFIISLLFIIFKKDFLKKEVYILLIWIGFFSSMVMAMPHKEDRYILLIVPAMCFISGFFISKLSKYKYIVLGLICIILLYSSFIAIKIEYLNPKDKASLCFSDGNKFLANNVPEKDSLVMTTESPLVHYYSQRDTIPYPDARSFYKFKSIISSKYINKVVYIFFDNYSMPMNSDIKKDLDNNFEKIFECSRDYGYGAIYKY